MIKINILRQMIVEEIGEARLRLIEATEANSRLVAENEQLRDEKSGRAPSVNIDESVSGEQETRRD